MDIDIDNYTWIASQIEDYHNSLDRLTPLEALQERDRIEMHIEHIRLPEYRKRELYRMLGGAKDE